MAGAAIFSPRRGSFPAHQKVLLLPILVILTAGWSVYSNCRIRIAEPEELQKPARAAENADHKQHFDQQQVLQISRNLESAEDLGTGEDTDTSDKGRFGPEFMLVTGERSSACKTSEGSHILMKSYKNKVDYCSLHGCKVWYSLETFDPDFRGTWARYPLLKQLMKVNPQVKWFMWMDADAIFTDVNFSIPFQSYETEGRDLIVPGYSEKVYGENPDWVGLNAGVFLIRNTNWSNWFLEKWMELGSPQNQESSTRRINEEIASRPQSWAADNQSALVYLLRHLNQQDRDEHTWLEVRYCLHGYFEQIIDKLEMFSAAERPFVSGCRRSGSGPSDRCVTGFQRAFNFADNQILALIERRHLHLNTSDVAG